MHSRMPSSCSTSTTFGEHPEEADQVLTSAYDRDEALAIADFLTQYNEGRSGIPHGGEAAFRLHHPGQQRTVRFGRAFTCRWLPILVLMLLR